MSERPSPLPLPTTTLHVSVYILYLFTLVSLYDYNTIHSYFDCSRQTRGANSALPLRAGPQPIPAHLSPGSLVQARAGPPGRNYPHRAHSGAFVLISFSIFFRSFSAHARSYPFRQAEERTRGTEKPLNRHRKCGRAEVSGDVSRLGPACHREGGGDEARQWRERHQ